MEAGPLYDHFRLTLSPGERTEAVGPFWSRERQEEESTVTLAPFYRRTTRPGLDAYTLDLLYPLLTYHRYGREFSAQVLELISVNGGQDPSGGQVRRRTFFPFYFDQRGGDPAHNYTALLPFYGRMEHHFFRDEIKLVMWPLYVRTRKGDLVTDNYFVPFVHQRHGPGLTGWQVWPLVGCEHKAITTRTNTFGDRELVGGRDETFVLWPFYIRNDLEVGTTNPVSERLVFPFYSAQRSPLRDSASYLWPLGPTLTEDREKQYREVDAPWPLVVFARGPGKTANRVLPLFSHARGPTQESDSYLWPLYHHTHTHSPPLEQERARIVFFLYSDLSEKNSKTGKVRRRTDFWPLFTARREEDGSERLQLLAPLEPLLPNNPGIERSWSPLWSLWRGEKNGQTGRASQSFLWNLCRFETGPQTKKCSLLFGLVQYESGPHGSRWRWFHLGRRRAAAPPGSQAPRSGAALPPGRAGTPPAGPDRGGAGR